jgi:hypothetical protein
MRRLLIAITLLALFSSPALAQWKGPDQRAVVGGLAGTAKGNTFQKTQTFSCNNTTSMNTPNSIYLCGGNTTITQNGEASIQANAAQGLQLLGKGSTSDFELFNSLGGGVYQVPTGTTTSAFLGRAQFAGVSLGTQGTGGLYIAGNAGTPSMNANGEGDIYLLGTTGGLALIGKGSTNDLTVLNSAGTTTLTIPTGTTNLVVAGTVQPGALTASLPVYTDASKNLSSTVPSGVPAVNAGGVTCGTGCSSVTGSGSRFTVTTGSAVTSVTVNFSTTWGATPVCVASDNVLASTGDISAVSTTAITFGFSAAVTTGTVYAICQG